MSTPEFESLSSNSLALSTRSTQYSQIKIRKAHSVVPRTASFCFSKQILYIQFERLFFKFFLFIYIKKELSTEEESFIGRLRKEIDDHHPHRAAGRAPLPSRCPTGSSVSLKTLLKDSVLPLSLGLSIPF